MYELYQECIRIVNLPYTVLFLLTLSYWVLYIVGVLGSDFLDFMDFDMDMDADVDMDADFGVEHSGGALTALMKFVHGGDVPMTVVISTLTMSMWVISILTNYYIKNTSGLIALGLFIPIFICGILITNVALTPFVPILKKAFDESGDSIKIIGKSCVVYSLEVTPKHGQAEIAKKGSPLIINVKTKDGDVLKKGDEAVVFEYDEKDGIYMVTKFDVDDYSGSEKV